SPGFQRTRRRTFRRPRPQPLPRSARRRVAVVVGARRVAPGRGVVAGTGLATARLRVVLVEALLEPADCLAEVVADVLQALGAEHQHPEHQHDQPVPETQTSHARPARSIGTTGYRRARRAGFRAAVRWSPGCPPPAGTASAAGPRPGRVPGW